VRILSFFSFYGDVCSFWFVYWPFNTFIRFRVLFYLGSRLLFWYGTCVGLIFQAACVWRFFEQFCFGKAGVCEDASAFLVNFCPVWFTFVFICLTEVFWSLTAV